LQLKFFHIYLVVIELVFLGFGAVVENALVLALLFIIALVKAEVEPKRFDRL